MNATDITAGTASLRGVDITDMEIEERAQAGIGLAFQRPPALAGVSVAKLAHAIGASDRLGAAEDALGLGHLGERDVNVGFSGGEAKRFEVMKLALQGPSLCLFDEPESGVDLEHFCQLRGAVGQEELDGLYRAVRDSAYEIIRRKGATYYGIAMAVGRIAECIVKDQHAVLPVSCVLEGQYGLEGLALSLPAIVGRNGLEEVLEIPLSPEERLALAQSAGQMKEAIASLKL